MHAFEFRRQRVKVQLLVDLGTNSIEGIHRGFVKGCAVVYELLLEESLGDARHMFFARVDAQVPADALLETTEVGGDKAIQDAIPRRFRVDVRRSESCLDPRRIALLNC